MKIGTEVEGRLKGIPTLFCQAEEIYNVPAALEFNRLLVSHVYISDNENILDYNEVSRFLPNVYITLDVTKVKTATRPFNVSLMLRVDKCEDVYASASYLNQNDQIKIERDRHVIVLPMTSAIYTMPHEFAGDRDL